MTREEILKIIRTECDRFNYSNGRKIAAAVKRNIISNPNIKYCVTSFKQSENKLNTGVCFKDNTKIVITTYIK